VASAIPIDQNLINESPDQSLTLKLAFCLYKYFPHGGLQRDFLRIALACQTLNHEIRVYTLEWKGEVPPGFDVVVVPVTALTNHTRYERFSDWVQRALLQDPVDVVIGINKMPGLDIYYAADSCYAEKAHTQRSWLYRQLPRYKHFSQYEKAVFGRDSETEIMMISQVQLPFFDRYYQTQKERVHFRESLEIELRLKMWPLFTLKCVRNLA
jgi:UDP-glucose:(heptosyl)LPS alpha-1,3-glucosyltransferase